MTYYDDIDSVVFAMQAYMDTNPDRMCAWCFHPRNSTECDFGNGHTPYVESFPL